MHEDTPEFVAKHIIREARSYLDPSRRHFSKPFSIMHKMVLIPGIVPVIPAASHF